jgi:hypothetical protein
MVRCERSSANDHRSCSGPPKPRANAQPCVETNQFGNPDAISVRCEPAPVLQMACHFRGTDPRRASRLGSSAVAGSRRSCRDDRAYFGRAKPGSIIESMVWCHNTSTFGQIRRESRLVQRGPQRHRASSGVGRDTQPPIGGGDAARGRAARLRAAILAEQFPAKTTMESVHDMVNPEQRPSCGRVAGGAMARARRMDFAATFAPLNRHE